VKKFNTKEQSKELAADINAGVLTREEMMVKYNYSTMDSFNSIMYAFKKRGLIDSKKIVSRKHLTPDQKNALLKDYASKKYRISELARKYNFSEGGTYNVIHRFKKKGGDIENIGASKPVVVPVKAVVTPKAIVTPKIVTNTMRTINFPDGFKIQIERAFVSGVLIHENGNITIIK